MNIPGAAKCHRHGGDRSALTTFSCPILDEDQQNKRHAQGKGVLEQDGDDDFRFVRWTYWLWCFRIATIDIGKAGELDSSVVQLPCRYRQFRVSESLCCFRE
jgi:hypothetical protein